MWVADLSARTVSFAHLVSLACVKFAIRCLTYMARSSSSSVHKSTTGIEFLNSAIAISSPACNLPAFMASLTALSRAAGYMDNLSVVYSSSKWMHYVSHKCESASFKRIAPCLLFGWISLLQHFCSSIALKCSTATLFKMKYKVSYAWYPSFITCVPSPCWLIFYCKALCTYPSATPPLQMQSVNPSR